MSSWALFLFFMVANQSEMHAAEELTTKIILKRGTWRQFVAHEDLEHKWTYLFQSLYCSESCLSFLIYREWRMYPGFITQTYFDGCVPLREREPQFIPYIQVELRLDIEKKGYLKKNCTFVVIKGNVVIIRFFWKVKILFDIQNSN